MLGLISQEPKDPSPRAACQSPPIPGYPIPVPVAEVAPDGLGLRVAGWVPPSCDGTCRGWPSTCRITGFSRLWHEYNLASESDYCKVKGQRRNQLRAVEQKHRAKGHTRKAGALACEDLFASMKSAQYRHRDTHRRLSGWGKGVMADTLTSIFRRRGLRWPWSIRPAHRKSTPARICCRAIVAGIGFTVSTGLCWTRTSMPPQHSGEAVRRGGCVVHAPRGGACPARGTNQDSGGDCPPRTRVAGACNGAPINRERITRPRYRNVPGKGTVWVFAPTPVYLLPQPSQETVRPSRQGTSSPFTQGTSALAGDANSSMELK